MGKKSRIKKELKEKFTPEALKALKKMRKSKPELYPIEVYGAKGHTITYGVGGVTKINRDPVRINQQYMNPMKKLAKAETYNSQSSSEALAALADKYEKYIKFANEKVKADTKAAKKAAEILAKNKDKIEESLVKDRALLNTGVDITPENVENEEENQ